MTLDLYSHHLFAFVLFTSSATSSSCVEYNSPGSYCTCSRSWFFFRLRNWPWFLTLYFSELLALSSSAKKEWNDDLAGVGADLWNYLYSYLSNWGVHTPRPFAECQCTLGVVEWGWPWRLVLLKHFKGNLNFITLDSDSLCSRTYHILEL